MARVFLLIGTNQGNLRTNIENALENIRSENIVIVKKSRILRTKPWGDENQPDFFNMALEIETSYQPSTLLSILKSIETRMGRNPDHGHWEQRIIDIDILFYDNRVIETHDLTIPHREFLNRPFAIQLLGEIAPEFTHPCTNKSVREYLES